MLKRSKEKAPPVIGGINVAAITPRREREVEVDLGAMLELVDFLGAHPIQGITVFGTTGEFVHYPIEERSRFVALLAKRSRVPVMANVSHSTLDGALRMAQEAADAGIAAVLVMPPHYFRYPSAAIEAFFLEFASQVVNRVPVYLYNIPAFTGLIPLPAIERLMASGLFAGIKDSSGDWESMEALLALGASRPFTIMAGDDRIFMRARRAGAHGAVTGVGCALPELMLALDRAILAGNTDAADRLDRRVQQFIDGIEPFPAPVAIKAAVAVRGVKVGPHAIPLGAETTRQLDRFRAWFREWLPDVLRECRDAGK